MRAGELRHRITIQQPADPPPRTSSGAVNKADPGYWEAYKSGVSAGEEPVNGREFYTAKGHFAEMTHLLKVRLDTDITNKMRVLFYGIPLDILAAQHFRGTPSTMKTLLVCKEGQSKGN